LHLEAPRPPRVGHEGVDAGPDVVLDGRVVRRSGVLPPVVPATAAPSPSASAAAAAPSAPSHRGACPPAVAAVRGREGAGRSDVSGGDGEGDGQRGANPHQIETSAVTTSRYPRASKTAGVDPAADAAEAVLCFD
ncbi:hypothetical protein THAOC_06882, partial [Thalassiosira oceanica]